MNAAYGQLRNFNENFTQDEKHQITLKNPKERIEFTVIDLQSLGQSLVKAFERPLSQK